MVIQYAKRIIKYKYYRMHQTLGIVLCCISLWTGSLVALQATADVQLYPNTQNSPSIYLMQFSLNTAIPSGSYILVTMGWYSSSLQPYNCVLVNTTISVTCSNLASLTTLATQVSLFNSLLSTAQTVAVQIGSNLLANTAYALQLHLYNVIPSIQKISPSIQMYTVSSAGLIYEANPNFGAVINNPPNTNIMSVNVINTLSTLNPGDSATLQVELTIGQAVSTANSTLIFVIQYPFTFSIGSIPTLLQSSSYVLNPIALYSKPTTPTFQVITPNVMSVVFSEQFVVGRRFIISINQINTPIYIWSSNISIYSANYNTLTPLQAFEGLYPISTVSYTLSPVLGLPYGAPFRGAMQYYQGINQFIQLTMAIPKYSVPNGYSILLQLTSATFLPGSAYYSGLNSLAYTPSYSYVSNNILIVTGMGPIVVGTTLTFNFKINIATSSLFNLQVYIDTAAVISAFTAPSYMYYGNVEGSGVTTSNFWNNIQDTWFTQTERVLYSTTYGSSSLQITIYQNIGLTSTSSGAWLQIYLSPYVQISSSFNQNSDCLINSVQSKCLFTSLSTTSYLKITISSSNAGLNIFSYVTYTTITLNNVIFSTSSSNQNVFPVYVTLYKTTGVAATPYYFYTNLHVMPSSSLFSGLSITYLNNYYTSTPSLYQTYTGVLRLESSTFSQLSFQVQPNQQFVIVLYAMYGFRSFSLANNASYPCTSNIGVSCLYLVGEQNTNQFFGWDRIIIFFSHTSYSTTDFHVLVPDTQTGQYTNNFFYQSGFYNQISKDIVFNCANSYSRIWNSWSNAIPAVSANMQADMEGKAGSYRTNVSITVYNPSITLSGLSFVFLCTQWSFFQNGITQFSASTLSMSTPATFGSTYMSPLSVYLTIGGMYLTIIPLRYSASVSPFTFYLDYAHMPYTYDLPTYYIYVASSAQLTVSSNSFEMANGGTLYGCPLQSLIVSCQDNAVGVVNTYCTVVFGTTNPLLASGNIRISLSGLTVSTSICTLTISNGTSIPVSCSTSSDKTNVTLSLSGNGFYTAGNFTLTFFGVGITSGTLSQSMTVYLYDAALLYVIESGNRILTTTIASLSYITLSQILYSYLNPLSSNTMTISFYLPRALYQDQQFTFVIGQDLSDVNTEVAKLNIMITRADGLTLFPLYQIDNVNNLIVFSFSDPTQLTANNYTMIIYGILTPASQSNGAFNMTYRRINDYTSTIVNSANVAFPSFVTLVTSNISLASYFNTEGYKQDIKFTITNTALNIDANMVWIINFPSYYSPSLFQQDSYCLLNTAVIPCSPDPNTPYQLIVSNSPMLVNAGVAYTLTVAGLAAPRSIYTNNAYPNRYIFIGVLQNSLSQAYAERNLLLPYQSVQSTVGGVITVIDMLGVSSSNLYSFSSIYARFELVCTVTITSGSYLYLDLPIQFDNLNNVPINAILIYGASVVSSTASVQNRRIQISVGVSIPPSSQFEVQIPDLPTPKQPCTVDISNMIVTVTLANQLAIYAASNSQGNSAPTLTFAKNSLYISFNSDQTIFITAGTYSTQILITPSDNSTFLSNTNIQLQSTGFIFQPSTVFLPIGVASASFRVGADPALVPVVHFYTAVKQEQVNTRYQITLNMNIAVTNDPIPITLPSSIVMPLGGCTNPFLIKLTNPPYNDLSITFTFNNSLYSESNFFPNPATTPSTLAFSSTNDNNTFSMCSSSSLSASQITLSFFLTGTNYNSYAFVPTNQMTVILSNSIANIAPTIQLKLNNQQKTFLDVNFTNNVDAMIYYQLQLGQNASPLSLQAIQLNIKTNTWVLAAPTAFLSYIYTTDVYNRLGQFFQTASTTTVRLSGLVPEAFYTLCVYATNVFSVSSNVNCIQLSTMTWGSVTKATLRFSRSLSSQQMNNVLCFFTISSGASQSYLVDAQGNSCGNRSVSNTYYKYTGSSVTTETQGTNIYLVTNPYIIGTDPSPTAFANLFSSTNKSLTSSTLTSAQSMFTITYLSGSYSTFFSSARQMTASSQASSLQIYYTTPSYNTTTQVLTVDNVQIIGGVGSVYFVLVLYKQISLNSNLTYVSIRMNEAPTAQQVLNCQNWLNVTAEGCARAVYTGLSPLAVTFSSVQPNSLYLMYYLAASEFPLRPVVSGSVSVQTVVTYKYEFFLCCIGVLLILWI